VRHRTGPRRGPAPPVLRRNVYARTRHRAFLPLPAHGRQGRLINVHGPRHRPGWRSRSRPRFSASKARHAGLRRPYAWSCPSFGIPGIQVATGGRETENLAKAARRTRRTARRGPERWGGWPSTAPQSDAVAASPRSSRWNPVSEATNAIVDAVLDRRPQTHYTGRQRPPVRHAGPLPRGTRTALLAPRIGLPRMTHGRAKTRRPNDPESTRRDGQTPPATSARHRSENTDGRTSRSDN